MLTADGADPLRSLAAALRRQAAPRRRTPYADGLVALFPQEVQRDPDSHYLATAHHDVPANAQDFVAKAGSRLTSRVRQERPDGLGDVTLRRARNGPVRCTSRRDRDRARPPRAAQA